LSHTNDNIFIENLYNRVNFEGVKFKKMKNIILIIITILNSASGQTNKTVSTKVVTWPCCEVDITHSTREFTISDELPIALNDSGVQSPSAPPIPPPKPKHKPKPKRISANFPKAQSSNMTFQLLDVKGNLISGWTVSSINGIPTIDISKVQVEQIILVLTSIAKSIKKGIILNK
jgi:hypothetical protein